VSPIEDRLNNIERTTRPRHTDRSWRRIFQKAHPQFEGYFEEFEHYVTTRPDYWDYSPVVTSFIRKVQNENEAERECEAAEEREAASQKTVAGRRKGLLVEVEKCRQAWIEAGGSEVSFEAARTEIEADILREKSAERRRIAVSVQDLL
jgi:hypothetical protein